MHFTIYFLALFFVPAFAAPVPPKHEPGDFVAVRHRHLQVYEGTKKQKDVDIHPGVVTKNHPDTGEVSVNLISGNYVSPHQEPIGNYYHHAEGTDTHLKGNVRFNSVRVKADVIRKWKNTKGGPQPPMEPADLKRLQEKTTETPLYGAHSSQPAAHGNPKTPAQPASSSNSKGHVNAHASSSKLPQAAPAQGHPPNQESKGQVNAHASSSKPPQAAPAQGHPESKGQAHASSSKLPQAAPAQGHPPHQESKEHVNAHASSSKLPAAVPAPAQGHNKPAHKDNKPAGKAGKGK